MTTLKPSIHTALELSAGLLVFAFLGSGCKTVKREDSLTAVVVRQKGNARCSPNLGIWQEVKVGSEFSRCGWMIQTAADSFVDLIFLGHVPLASSSELPRVMARYLRPAPVSLLRVQQDSAVVLQTMTTRRSSNGWDHHGAKAIRINLVNGQVFVKTQQLVPHSSFETCTTNGVIRILDNKRGMPDAMFQCSNDGVVQVLDGAVEFMQHDPEVRVKIPSGNAFDVRTRMLTAVPEDDKPFISCPGPGPGAPIPPAQFSLPARKF